MFVPEPFRFAHLWRRVSATGDSEPVVAALLSRWAEPQRHYHTLAHLHACLAALDAHRSFASSLDALELALWFHDAIYDPRSSDNETRSADLAAAVLRSASVPAALIDSVRRLILATRAHEADDDPDTALLLDIDLAILGARPDAYRTYAAAIRREYAWVPAADYCAKRSAILARFLQRPRLFLTTPFFTRLEPTARANLSAEIRSLDGA